MSGAATDAPIRRRRARWPWVVLIGIVLLVVLALAAEALARSILPATVRGLIVERLDLPSDQQVDVETTGILLPQLMSGRLDELHLSSDQVTLEGITGAVRITAEGLALRGDDLESAHGSVTLAEQEFTTLLEGSDLPFDTLELADGHATANGSFQVLALSVPFAITVTPSAAEGDLVLTPQSLRIAGAELTAAQVRDRFGQVGHRLTEPWRICIADQLPAALTLTGLRVEGASAVGEFDIAGAVVTDERMQQPGTCD